MSATATRLLAYAAAMTLLAATVAASHLPLTGLRVGLHLGVAAGQAAVVFGIFMELREAPPLVRIFALGAFVWLAIMLGFFAVDYWNR